MSKEPTFDGTTLRAMLVARGLSVAAFARLIPCARETASSWCSGSSVPSVENAGRIAKVLTACPLHVVGVPHEAVTVGELVGLP